MNHSLFNQLPELGEMARYFVWSDFPNVDFTLQLKKHAIENLSDYISNVSNNPLCQKIWKQRDFLNLNLQPCFFQPLVDDLNTDHLFKSHEECDSDNVVCIDYSSPNIAKPMAYHHIRSTVIGNCISKCYKLEGWTVIRINYLGDWGTSFGKLLTVWHKLGKKLEDLTSVDMLYELYRKFSELVKDDPAMNDSAREWSRKLEEHDDNAVQLWRHFKEITLAEFDKVYKLFNVEFDSYKGEAACESLIPDTLKDLQKAGILEREDAGEQLVKLPNMPPCIILRSDGGTLYATRDLAACEDRYRTYGFTRSLYVVDQGQSLHFRQWFEVCKMMDKPYAGDLMHIPFGPILMSDAEQKRWFKGRSRTGETIGLIPVLEKAIDIQHGLLTESKKLTDLNDDLTELARQIGCGAVIFNVLKIGCAREIKFTFDGALNVQGETGPYLQYTHARLCSILQKSNVDHPESKPELEFLHHPMEKELVKALVRLPEWTIKTLERHDPSHLCRGIIHLAKKISAYLSLGSSNSSLRVLNDDVRLRESRVKLVHLCREALSQGLSLLGISSPEKI